MRLRLSAEPEELLTKGDALVRALAQAVEEQNPTLADQLYKALPELPPGRSPHPVMEELRQRFVQAYDKQMQAMLKDIGKVLDGAVKDVVAKSDTDVTEPLRKSFFSHKYLSRKMANGKWQYTYANGKEHLRNYHEPTPEEFHAVESYTGSAYAQINRFLRKTEKTISDENKAHMQHIHNVVARNSTHSDGEVHRGIMRPGRVLMTIKPGDVYTDPGFTSASRNEKEAGFFGKDVMMHIAYAAGDHAIDVNEHIEKHAKSSEEEMIFQNGTSYHVDRVEQKGVTRHIWVSTLARHAKNKG